MTTHQQKQVEIINRIEAQVKNKKLNFTMVAPVADYENDTRICLTSVHFPKKELLQQVQQTIIDPLKQIAPDLHYYSDDSLHMTVKNIRVINDPPHFTDEDSQKAKTIFSEIIPHHNTFNVFFYRLLLFPNNLALIGTTDPELDKIILNLDQRLNEEGLPDDKKYSNSEYYFCSMTLARFSGASDAFKNKVEELSNAVTLAPYTVDSVTLLTCNAVFKKQNVLGTWHLR